MNTIAVHTAARLHCLLPDVSYEVISSVAESAEMAHCIGFTALFEAANADGIKWIRYGDNPGAFILDMPSDAAEDTHEATVVCLPMARDLDMAELRRASALKLLLPGERVIVVGSPAGWHSPDGRLTRTQRRAVRAGGIAPEVAGIFHYLREQGIQTVNWVGTSYGAHKAVAAAAEGEFRVRRVVAIEPPDIVRRRFWRLALDFLSTSEAVPDYKHRLTDPVFIAALEQQPRLLRYIWNLASPANVAITHGIKRGQFADNLRTVLERAPDAQVTVAWGTASELVPHATMEMLLGAIADDYPGRVEAIPLAGEKHASYLDVDVIHAVIAHGLRRQRAAENIAKLSDSAELDYPPLAVGA